MDNIAHTLAGITLGCALMSVPPLRKDSGEPVFRAAVLWTSFVANNLPDVDSVFSEIFEPGNLGQLLNHRSYTHSFVFVPFGGAIAAVMGLWAAYYGWSVSANRRGGQGTVPGFRAWFNWSWFWKMLLVGAAGILAHIFMDWWNDYGIHPFSPFWNGWIHADTVSVVEPLLWFAILPFAWILSKGARVRFLVLGLFGGILAILWLGPFTRGWVALLATVWAALAWMVQVRATRGRSGKFGWIAAASLAAGVVVAFAAGSRVVRERLDRVSSLKSEQVYQLIRSPAPADPLCWRVITVSRRGDNYVMRYGVMSFWPRLADPRTCFYGAFDEKLAPLTPVTDTIVPGVVWVGEFVRPMSELEKWSRASCEFETFRRFSRAPFWTELNGKEVFGDLRYDRGRKLGFSTIVNGSGCLKWEPPWLYQVL